MTTFKGPRKGQAAALRISPEPPGRFFAGLAWSSEIPAYEKLTGIRRVLARLANFDRMSGKTDDAAGRDAQSDFLDLDLYCHVFDAALKPVLLVGPENENIIDASRKVYHSDDNSTGRAGPDDETVSVETRGLPENYCHLFFTVRADSKYSLEEFTSPKIRLADGKTMEAQLENDIRPPAHLDASAYVFCHVFRDGAGWKVRNIDEYAAFDAPWDTLLPGLIKA